ncbi:N-acetylmuramoyl-L-alanine amidase [Clostridium bornimense]|uniref:N-acetylmuramoyl-L-alanine amidase n=1 Tax=Clostridium bornimense TaxID=1216932 RepID=W6RSC9_9CLOT|nr:N-acetylmuramoyl-L-alanine amidase [Clostridium bornimense]CDM67481.1 N-acetylmuramoyl-L-alanine amidase [Clostridium bornimense]
MKIEQQLIDSDKYKVKCPYSMEPIGICIHNTANDASAQSEINYMKSNNNSVSFHIAIDNSKAIQAIPFNRNTWHAGDGSKGKGNRKYISIEICYSKSGGDKFIKAEKNAAKVTAQLLKKYGWTTSAVKKHQDFSNKYCPHRTLDMGWSRFVNMVKKEYNGNSNDNVYRVRKSWADESSQVGAYSVLANAIKKCDEHKGYSVFNGNGKKVYPKSVTMYRVRKKWSDESSQIGAFKELDNAIELCDKNKGKGYSVFDNDGLVVYSA